MNKNNVYIAIVSFGLASVAWSNWQLSRSASNAQSAAERLALCRQLAGEIESLREPTPRAYGEELTPLLKAAATTVAVDPNLISNVYRSTNGEPDADKEQETTSIAEFDAITARELALLISEISTNDEVPTVTLLSMTAPNQVPSGTDDQPEEDLWNVKITLTNAGDSSKSTMQNVGAS